MSMPWHRVLYRCINDPGRLIYVHIMRDSLIVDRADSMTLYELAILIFDTFDLILDPMWRQGSVHA